MPPARRTPFVRSIKKQGKLRDCPCGPGILSFPMDRSRGLLQSSYRPSMEDRSMTQSPDFLPGTLEMLILNTLSRGPNHGWGIAQHIQQVSEDALRIGEGSLYPALQHLLLDGCVAAEWGTSENNRRARFYRITPIGRKRLAEERKRFESLIGRIARVMEST
jgi:PadR family transcriptional regulator PadR